MAWYKLDEEGNIEGLLKPLAPLINYVARLNGTDQYWQLSEEINTGTNFDFSISTQIEVSGPSMITGANNRDVGGFFHHGGKVSVRDTNGRTYTTLSAFPIGSGAIFDMRVLVVNGNLSLYVNDELQSMNRANDGTFAGLFLHRIGRRVEDKFYNKGITYGFLLKDVSGTVINSIPLTNKAQGATQLATVGNVNATMIGYTPDVWEQE